MQPSTPITADYELVRRLNTATILDCLRLNTSLSRAGLSAHTGLNRSTVSSIVSELIDNGLVRETALQKDKVGRPGMALELDPGGGSAIGVEIGVDQVGVVLVDFCAQPLWKARRDLPVQAGLDEVLATAEALVAVALAQAPQLRTRGIGVAVPGLVDAHAGEVKIAPNLHWHNVPVRQRWAERFGLPVFVENEAKAAALGEYYFGAARHVKDFIYLSAGVGVGAGIMVHGTLLRGRGGYAGEIGHMMIDPRGRPCNCGRRGCWETLVGSHAVVRAYLDAIGDTQHIPAPTFDSVVHAAEQGDPAAGAVLNEAARWLGIGIANLVHTFNPELVIIGGDFARAYHQTCATILATVREFTLPQPLDQLVLTVSQHGDDACMIGTATLVLDDILRAPALRTHNRTAKVST